MKSRTKALMIASIPVLAVGTWGVWVLARTSLLESGLRRSMALLEPWGIVTQHAPVRWKGLWTAEIDHLAAFHQGGQVGEARDIVIHLKPILSRHGRSWVKAVELGRVSVDWGGWQMEGKAWCSPTTLAMAWEGEVCKEPLPACGEEGDGFSMATHVRLATGPQLRRQGMRSCTVAMVASRNRLNHPLLGNETKDLGELAAWLKVEAGHGRLALRPGSRIRLHQAHALMAAEWNARFRSLAFRSTLPSQPVQDILNPLAALAPQWLQGIRATGQVDGHLAFTCDLDSLESLRLNGRVNGHEIAVAQYGAADLRLLAQKETSRDAVALHELPAPLIQAVLLSEDAHFWEHHGFDPDIIRLALIDNLQQGRFARGAGTIPMQLIRNMFLHHGKQADRKLAEVVLTWLAEEQQLLDKTTQLERYLNLIEWGPKIRGIDAAAHHYFQTSPAQLTVDQSIFLACIIPNPHYAHTLLEVDGSLTPYAQAYYDSMRWMLYEGEWIGEEWLEADYPRFVLKNHS